MKSFISILLLLVALALWQAFKVLLFVYGCFASLSEGSFAEWIKRQAVSIDQHGNVVGCYLFDDVLGEGFGDEDETISSRLGKLKKDGKLKPLGKVLAWVLNKIDTNHVEKSIE